MNEEIFNSVPKYDFAKLVNVKTNTIETGPKENALPTKLYKRRWGMLAIFIICAVTSNMQFSEYSIISNIISRYYNVSRLAVNGTSMVFLMVQVIFIIPVFFLLEKLSLRTMILIGCATSCLGAWIKTFSLSSDRFHILMIGQFFAALDQPLRLAAPGRVAAKWFGAEERSTASGLGIMGIHFGILVSNLLPTIIVKNHDNLIDINRDLTTLTWTVAIGSTISLSLGLLFFQDEPKLPPSRSRALQMAKPQINKSVLAPIGRLLVNKQFLQLCFACGLIIGLLDAFATMFNEIFLTHYEDGQDDIGKVYLLLQVSGITASVLSGMLLDKTHKFKEVAIVTSIFCLCSQMMYSTSLILKNKLMTYIAVGSFGFWIFAFLTDACELGIEFTYPEDEILAMGTINVFAGLFGVIIIFTLNKTRKLLGEVFLLAAMNIFLFIGLIIIIFIKDVQKRQNASVNDTLYQRVRQRNKEDE